MIGVFSGACLESFDPAAVGGDSIADAAAFNRRTRLFRLSAGTAEERIHQGLLRLHAALEERGIRHEAYESLGTSHEWLTWQRSLRAFAQRLFRA